MESSHRNVWMETRTEGLVLVRLRPLPLPPVLVERRHQTPLLVDGEAFGLVVTPPVVLRAAR